MKNRLHQYFASYSLKVILLISLFVASAVQASALEVDGASRTSKKKLIVSPEQVVISGNGYIELPVGEYYRLSFFRYPSSTSSSVVWSSTNLNVTIDSQNNLENSAVIKAQNAGTAKISVEIDGRKSQEITIRVIAFDGDAAITTQGAVISSYRKKFCFYINRNLSENWLFSSSLIDENHYSGTSSNPGKQKLCSKILMSATNPLITFNAAVGSAPSIFGYRIDRPPFVDRSGSLILKKDGQSLGGLEVSANDSRFLNFSSDFSITFWGYVGKDGGLPNIELGGTPALSFSSEGLRFRSSSSTGNIPFTLYLPTAGNSPSDFNEDWHFLGITFSSLNRVLKLYLDGVEIGAKEVPPTDLSSGDNVMRLFGDSRNRAIDDLRFWNKALSAEELNTELTAPALGNSPSLLATFSFNQAFGPKLKSDNGSLWFIKPSRGNLDDVAMYSAGNVIILDSYLNPGTRYLETITSPFREFGNSGEYGFDIETWDIVVMQPIRLVGAALRSDGNETNRTLEELRISPITEIGPLKNVVSPISLSFPVNTFGLNSSQQNQIKVVRQSGDERNVFEILEPLEIDAHQGSVKVQISKGGTYWVSVPTGHSTRAVDYSNSDLVYGIDNSDGSRSYGGHYPASPGTYILSASNASSFEGTIKCDDTATIGNGSAINLPVLLPINVAYSVNFCSINEIYLKGSADEYSATTKLMLQKEAL